jgi:hypothetical protein
VPLPGPQPEWASSVGPRRGVLPVAASTESPGQGAEPGPERAVAGHGSLTEPYRAFPGCQIAAAWQPESAAGPWDRDSMPVTRTVAWQHLALAGSPQRLSLRLASGRRGCKRKRKRAGRVIVPLTSPSAAGPPQQRCSSQPEV